MDSGDGARPQAPHLTSLALQWRGRWTGDNGTGTMKQAQRLTAIIEREDEGFVALCPELDIASQGDSIEASKPDRSTDAIL